MSEDLESPPRPDRPAPWRSSGAGVCSARSGPGARTTADVTFNRDVMPILQANCQECHQANSVAPMELHDLPGRIPVVEQHPREGLQRE